ncbi:MAG: DUF948 domain-containing protein [Armatimonadota bacterium]
MNNTLLYVLLSIIVFSLSFLIIAFVFYIKKLNKILSSIENDIKVVRIHIEDISSEVRSVISNANNFVSEARIQLKNVDIIADDAKISINNLSKILTKIETILDLGLVTGAAAKAVSSSAGTVKLLFEGIKEGIKTLKTKKEINLEDNKDEQ